MPTTTRFELDAKINARLNVERVRRRVSPSAPKHHTFTMELTPNGRMSSVMIDDTDITRALRGVMVVSAPDYGTRVELLCAVGQAALIRAAVQGADVAIVNTDDLAVAIERACQRLGVKPPADLDQLVALAREELIKIETGL